VRDEKNDLHKERQCNEDNHRSATVAMKFFYTIFWSWLTLSGVQPFIVHAKEHRWWMCFFGMLAMTWTSYNTYVNAKSK